VLLVATVLAAFVIFTPARRKLAALEAAAERMRTGDLRARAPEHGADEIARVARAFNRMGDELAARDEAVRRVDQLRRQMLADVSHELKTPLTGMRGFIETLQMPEIAADPERRARYFSTLSRETTRLERIVSDLLDVARLEHGVAEFETQVLDTRRLFEQVGRRHEHAAAASDIRLLMDVEDGADQISGDPHRLEQALENLVANAMRHAPRGSEVAMLASLVPEGVCLAVRDTGPGIPPEHLDHVFERFYKADPSRAATREGSGLGLSIVKAIVQRHGGEIRVTSRPGHTLFSMILPQDAPA
jgi:two-component system sensor histidine kinase BaeS